MKTDISCEIIRDLLPTYSDGIAEEETASIIEEHLAECESCRTYLEGLSKATPEAVEDSQAINEALQQQQKKFRRITGGVVALILVGVLIFGAVNLKPVVTGWKVTDAQQDSLMEQLAASEGTQLDAKKGVPDKWFAVCKVFGMEKSGSEGYIFAWVDDGEFVAVKDKAYSISGGSCAMKLHVKFDGDKVKLLGTEMPMDGMEYTESMRELFPLFCRWMSNSYSGSGKLQGALNQKVKAVWGISVSENQLEIKGDNYEVYKVDSNYDSITLEKGTLASLKKNR